MYLFVVSYENIETGNIVSTEFESTNLKWQRALGDPGSYIGS
jgi:hypothetical protein